MSEENKGVRGAASLRLKGMKISELPMGMREQAIEQMPAFIEEQRRNKVDRIIARFPKGQIVQYEARIRECEANIKMFVQAKEMAMHNIGRYMDLLRKRDGDLSWDDADQMVEETVQAFIDANRDNPDLVDGTGKPVPNTLPFRRLMGDLDKINSRRRAYEDEALWKQIGLFQEERDRYDGAVQQETDSIFALREAILSLRERDQLIKRALSEPIAVE
jgi:hypothetical protein